VPTARQRAEKGEQKQAVGRSRGGRNTKIHALADANVRLLAILLTGGEADDCPVAKRLIRRAEPSKYTIADLREELHGRGTKPIIPNRSNRKQFQQAPVQGSMAYRRMPSTD
jgi:hypothetical protein